MPCIWKKKCIKYFVELGLEISKVNHKSYEILKITLFIRYKKYIFGLGKGAHDCPRSKESECARVLTLTSQDVPELLITCTLTSQDVPELLITCTLTSQDVSELLITCTLTSQDVLELLPLHHKMC